jgi:hypothetical protein
MIVEENISFLDEVTEQKLGQWIEDVRESLG